MQELYVNILEEKVEIERLRIGIGYWNDSELLRQEKAEL